MERCIYLGGTFSGQKMGELKARRENIKNNISFRGFKVIDPLRGKANNNEGNYTAEELIIEENFTPNEIVHRDLNDILKADIILLDWTEPSIGSACELMFASEKQKIILVISNNPKVTNHPWIMSLATKIFKNEKDFLDYLPFFC